jgi:hypothetical protein
MNQQLRLASVAPWVILAFLAFVPDVSAQSIEEVSYAWGSPETGSPVHHYIVEHSVNGGPFAQIATASTGDYTLIATVGDTHQIRVAGVDALGRQGPFSVPSEPYAPELGPPGQPGQPIPIF